MLHDCMEARGTDHAPKLVFASNGHAIALSAQVLTFRATFAQADLIHAALPRLGVHDPVVLGHSWGALVALSMGLRHPQDIGSLVLASGYYFPTLRLDTPLLAGPALPGIGALWRFAPQFSVRLDLDRNFNVGRKFALTSDTNGRFDNIDAYTVNLIWKP